MGYTPSHVNHIFQTTVETVTTNKTMRVKSFVVTENTRNLSNPQSSQVLSTLWQEGLANAFFKNDIETNKPFTETEFVTEWRRLANETGLDFSGITFSNGFQLNAKALLNSLASLEIKDKRSKIVYINGQRSFGVSNRLIQMTDKIEKTYQDQKGEDGTPLKRTFNLAFATVTQDGVTFQVSGLSNLPVGTPVNVSIGCYVATDTNGGYDLRFGSVIERYIVQEVQQPVVVQQAVPNQQQAQPVPQPETQPQQPQQPETQPEQEAQPVGDGGLDIGA